MKANIKDPNTSLTMTLDQVAELFRANGIRTNKVRLADGIASGAYPFGRVVGNNPNRRCFEIWRKDVEAFLEERRPVCRREEDESA